jgi:hypothetical protein
MEKQRRGGIPNIGERSFALRPGEPQGQKQAASAPAAAALMQMNLAAAMEATVRLRVASFRRSQRRLIGCEVSQIEAMRSIWQVRARALVHFVVTVVLGLGVNVVIHLGSFRLLMSIFTQEGADSVKTIVHKTKTR